MGGLVGASLAPFVLTAGASVWPGLTSTLFPRGLALCF